MSFTESFRKWHNDVNPILLFRIIYFFVFFGSVFIPPYLPLFLSAQHQWSNTLLGVLAMCQRLTSFFVTPAWGYIADKTQRLRFIVLWCYTLTPICNMAIMLFAGVSWQLCFAMVLLTVILSSGGTPVTDRSIVKVLIEMGRNKSEVINF